MKSVFAALVPPGVVTSTLLAPAVPAGVVQVMVVALTTTLFVTAVPPKVTPVAPVKPVPVSVTAVPPAMLPALGATLVSVGGDGGATYVKSVFAALVPPGVVTTTLTAPAARAGVVQVIVAAFTTFKAVALVPPKVTLVAPVKFVPVSVTTVPPAVLPVFGATLVSVGSGIRVKT